MYAVGLHVFYSTSSFYSQMFYNGDEELYFIQIFYSLDFTISLFIYLWDQTDSFLHPHFFEYLHNDQINLYPHNHTNSSIYINSIIFQLNVQFRFFRAAKGCFSYRPSLRGPTIIRVKFGVWKSRGGQKYQIIAFKRVEPKTGFGRTCPQYPMPRCPFLGEYYEHFWVTMDGFKLSYILLLIKFTHKIKI